MARQGKVQTGSTRYFRKYRGSLARLEQTPIGDYKRTPAAASDLLIYLFRGERLDSLSSLVDIVAVVAGGLGLAELARRNAASEEFVDLGKGAAGQIRDEEPDEGDAGDAEAEEDESCGRERGGLSVFRGELSESERHEEKGTRRTRLGTKVRFVRVEQVRKHRRPNQTGDGVSGCTKSRSLGAETGRAGFACEKESAAN